jgi:hypothetical protein
MQHVLYGESFWKRGDWLVEPTTETPYQSGFAGPSCEGEPGAHL